MDPWGTCSTRVRARAVKSALIGTIVTCLTLWVSCGWAGAVEEGLEAYRRGAWEEAYGHWLQGAADGDNEAQFYVSRLLAEGQGVRVDETESLRWLKYSARGGFPPAQFNLGNSYRTGDGVRRDPSQAVYWWTRAAEAGFVQAQYNLALLYFRGDGVIQNLDQALAWAIQADAAGSQEAATLIGEISNARAQRVTSKPAGSGVTTAGIDLSTLDEPLRIDGGGERAERPEGPSKQTIGSMNLQWVLDQAPERLTLQVFSTRSLASALRARGLLGEEQASAVFPFRRGGGQWYGVVFGSVVGERRAEALKAGLPVELSTSRPLIRRFRYVQANVDWLGEPLKSGSFAAVDVVADAATERGNGAKAVGPPEMDSGSGLNTAWIMGQAPEAYTVQVFSTRSVASVRRVRAMLPADAPSGAFPFVRDDGLWYGVVVGRASRPEDADAIREALPPVLKETGPVVRRFGRIQDAIRDVVERGE